MKKAAEEGVSVERGGGTLLQLTLNLLPQLNAMEKGGPGRRIAVDPSPHLPHRNLLTTEGARKGHGLIRLGGYFTFFKGIVKIYFITAIKSCSFVNHALQF